MFSILMSLAFAQDVIADAEIPPINVQHFRPTVDGLHTLWTDDSARGEHKRFFARPLFHYTRQPLVYEYDDGRSIALVNNLLQADLMGGFSYERFRLGVNLPVFFYADGQDQPSQNGVGDVAVDGKFTLLDGDSAPGVAVSARMSLPTSSIDELPLGNAKPGWELSAIVDQAVGDFKFMGNLGVRGGNKAELENVKLDDFFVFRAAGAYLFDEDSGVALELAGDVPFSANAGAGLPLEVMFDGYTRVAPAVMMRGGLGTSLTNGIAAPDYRVLLGFEWRPQPDDDRDNDGIEDDVDACPDVAEDKDDERDEDGCPENIGTVQIKVVGPDGEVLKDAAIGMGDLSGSGVLDATVEGGAYTAKVSANGYEPVEQAIEIVDADAGRVIEITLKKVEVPMGVLKVRVENAAGEPIDGAVIFVDGEKNEGAVLEQSVKAGDHQLKARAEGFKPSKAEKKTVAKDGTVEVVFTLEEAKAELKGERIDLRDRVYFDTAKATIQTRSFGLLDEVVAILADHPELTKLRIEGHTDSRGSASYNKALSQRRADSVKAFLVSKGVSADRLTAVGYGEEKPLDPAKNDAAYTKNRRVDFFVAERTD